MGIERILIADGNPEGREFLERALLDLGPYEVEAFADGDAARQAFMKRDFDLILVAEELPGVPGRRLVRQVKDARPSTSAVLLVDAGRTAGLAAALEAGAEDCCGRPYDLAGVKALLQKLAWHRRLVRENDYLRDCLRAAAGADVVVGESAAIRAVVGRARELGRSGSPVILAGEHGTGRRTLARLMHRESERARGPFIHVRCAGLPESLLERELFGQERGAVPGADRKREGRFALADGGILVLEALEELPINLQARLLRFLEEGAYRRVGGTRPRRADVRIVGTTRRDLAREVEAGGFRRDLYRRFGDATLRVPPLRDREGDVPLLVSHYLNRCREGVASQVRSVTPEAMDLLAQYRWPGNVWELRNLVQRQVVLNAGEEITPEHLPPEITGAQAGRTNPFEAVVGMSIHEVEREMILKTLEDTGNNKTAAAKILGLTARTLHNKLKLYREQGIIDKDAYRPLRKRALARPAQPTYPA